MSTGNSAGEIYFIFAETALDGFRKALIFDGLALDLNENTVNTTNSNMSEEIKCNSK